MAEKKKARPSRKKNPTGPYNNRNELNNILISAHEYHQSGALDKAGELYKHILDHNPDHPDALHLLGVISYQNQDLKTAESLIKKALTLNPDAPEYKCNLGNVFREAGKGEEAISCYRDAIKHKPDFAQAYNNLGACLKAASKIQESIQCYTKAIEIKPDYVAAYNNLGNIFRETGEIDQAIDAYQRAVKLNPGHAEAYNSLGNTLWDKGNYDEATICFKKTIELKPDFAQAHLSLSKLIRNTGNIPEAIASCKQAIAIMDDYADAHHHLGTLYHETGNYTEARDCFQKELDIRPDNPKGYNGLGMALHHSGRPEDAISCYNKALELDPDFAEAYSNLGIALHDTGRTEEAIRSHKKALALDAEFAQAHNNLGGAFLGTHKTEKAITSFRQALHIKPDFIEAHNNLGLALKDIKRYEDAHIAFQNALDINPDFVDARINSGSTYKEECRFTEAISEYKKAITLNPHSAEAYANAANIFTLQGRMKEALSFYNKALKIDPDHATIHSSHLFSLHYQDPIDFKELFRKHVSWGKQQEHLQARNTGAYTNDRTPERRLRIGYVSPDFRTHSVSYFIEPVLAAHNDSTFEIFCYSNVTNPDETTKRIKTLVKNWRDISGLRVEEIERIIRKDEIDILIDLAGHTAINHLTLFARLPAPIQATYLGYPNTTGLSNMHYRITDAYADPPGKTDHLFTEKLLRLPRGFLCYQPPDETPDIVQPPVNKTGKVTFGSFNNRSKITPSVVHVWSEILKSIPGSQLILKSKAMSDQETQRSLLNMFVQNGVRPEQIGFIGSIPEKFDHLDLYNSCDIALDTFPYNGTTTTCEALWMGVPVIALKGEVHMSRVGVSLLTNAGLEEFIADTPDDYVEKAVSLANDPERLSRLREKQRGIMASSPLMDAHGFTQDLEKAYRKIWDQWCTMDKESLIAAEPSTTQADGFTAEESSSPKQAEFLNEEGEKLFCAGQTDNALNAFNKALEIDPEYVAALNNLGVLYWHKGDIHKAIERLQQVLEIDPDNEDAAYNLREIQEAQQNPVEQKNTIITDKPDQADDTCLRVNIKGGIQVCVPPSIQFMTPYILIEQEDWFEEEIHYIRKLLHEGINVIDIGANYGLYTLTMSKIIGPSGKVWAFEPTSLTATFLRKSILANHMTNIELVQAGLSDKKGTANISLNPNPELNAITAKPESEGKYETVELLSLDECENTYSWDTIDFIKLDAEGQEHNIVLGGKHFLSTRSPLIMFELKHGGTVNVELIDDFSELGYQIYHLIPGLNILAPIDSTKSFDPYQLNLFCCKKDRAQLLQEQGLLITESPSPHPIIDATIWQQRLQTMPYFKVFMGCWASLGQGKTLPGWDHYENALNYYVMAHTENQTAHLHYANLKKALEESSQALDKNVNISRQISHVRIQSELGKRGDSILTVDSILNLIGSEKTVVLSEPFIPISPRFDNIIPTEMTQWLLASILEYCEKTKAFSSFYLSKASLEHLDGIKKLGYQTPEMERRRQLVRMRYGLQREPISTPILSSKTSDNLNPELWNTGDSTFTHTSFMSRNLVSKQTEPTIDASRPRLSICIPTYNRAELLRETLAHLEQVCDDDVEIIISDNCSPDHTQEVINIFASRFRHFLTIRQSENRGALKNVAAAMSLARGKYIYTLCDDDQIYPEGLQLATSIMDENPQIVAVYGGYQEWDRTNDKILATRTAVDQRTDFVQGDKMTVFNRFAILWFPVCRTDIFQRYFTYDNNSFGMWELIGTLLEHGDIATIPDLFYKHAHTVPRMEYELTESWYHDAHRAQYECFAGRIGPLNFADLSTLINSRVAPAYMQGARFAEFKLNFLKYRHFLLRSRAYGLVPEAQVMEWEKREMVNMVAERLLGHVELIPEIEEVLFEDNPRLQTLCENFSAIAPGYAIKQISQDNWQENGLRPNQYLVTYSYVSPGWNKTVILGPARCRAVQDIIETCRITDQPLDF